MLRISGLTKIYTSKKSAAVEALSSVSLDFGDKGLVFLLGKSGSGKSTMLNLIGGLDKPTSGEIVVGRQSSASFTGSDFDSYRNTHVGFVFQEYNLIEKYTVGTNIGLALELQGKAADSLAIDDLLKKVGLVERGETLYDRHVDELSGGQKQRVAIARALIKSPDIILADEPTGALDSETGRQLYELLKELSKEKLIIVVSHDRANAETYGDRIIELADGKVISDSNPMTNPPEKVTEKVEFIKSRLPVKRAAMFGASALAAKPIRLVLCILLAVLSFFMFGFILTARTANEITAEINALADSNNRMVTLSGCTRDNEKRINSINKEITPSQLEVIKKNSNSDYVMAVTRTEINFTQYLSSHGGYSSYYSNQYERIVSDYEFRVAELDPTTGAKDARLTPDARLSEGNCRLPKDYTEIAITDLHAEMLLKYGYVEFLGYDLTTGNYIYGEEKTISKVDDVIGLKLGELTVCGVYSTEQDLAKYKAGDYGKDDPKYISELMYGASQSVIAYGFVHKGYAENVIFKNGYNRVYDVLFELSGNRSKDNALINDLTYKIGTSTSTSVEITSLYSGLMSAVSYLYSSDVMITMMTIALIIFALLTVVIMSNYISVGLDFKKRELGILRALGARNIDMLKVCLAESWLMAAIEFALALVAVIVVCIIINSLYLPILFVGVGPIAAMLVFAVVVSTLATAWPMRKIFKKNSIDLINRGE